jgi:hypothetical protein
MIFAELEYPEGYREIHAELVSFIGAQFPQVMSGIQGDSWIWISDGEEKVEVDTFSSMKHQIKSAKAGTHVLKVIEVLQLKYKVIVYDNPELEAHEE